MNFSKTVRDRAISSEFLTPRVVQECPMQRGKFSIFATFGGHLGFLRKMKKCEYLENGKRYRAILSEFLTPRVVQECPMQGGKFSIFATFGGHLGFLRKMKKCEYLENRKRAISNEILTPRVVQECPMQNAKISIFATFGGHLGFLRKMKKCEYLENRKR